MTKKLEGKTAVIVGASAGIGQASAQLFAEHGANVVLVGRNRARLDAAVAEIGEQAIGVAADVCFGDQLKAAFDAAVEKWGGVDIVFNNAGPGDIGLTPTHELTEEQFDHGIAVNLRAVWLGMKFGIPLMEEAGGGSIISTSSVAAISGVAQSAPYSAGKLGCHALSRTVAAEVSHKNIRVNVIVPGSVTTRFGLPSSREQSEADIQARRERGKRVSPMRRSSDAEEIANLALFLASDDSSFITGQAIVADGGMTAVNAWLAQGLSISPAAV